MNILNENELKTIDTTKHSIGTPATFQTLTNEDATYIAEWTSGVLNALDAFGSEHFVVACIGMLKAGKSTLINLLARNKGASPTGFGFDTTLRPVLITSSTEPHGTVEVWLPNTPEQKLTKVSLNEVFLCLRKVKKPEEVKGASCYAYPLTPANLENALCRAVLEADNNMLPCEPVMVVVKVPPNKDSPLSSEIVLLDTPGLDSGLSNWTKESSERYSWIIDNSDLLLFLQSSVAPLNRNAAAILRDIHAKSPNTPVWLVQNEMCSKPWLPLERITEENNKQRTQAARMFNTVCRAFKQVNANLGKADSAVFDDTLSCKMKKELLNESQFASVEANIKDDLIRNIGPIRRQNCIDAVKRETKTMQDGLTEIAMTKYRSIRISTPTMKRGIEWLNEHFLPEINHYDAIIGYRADDSYFSFARAFVNNEISLHQLGYAMKLGELGEQFVLKSEKAFSLIQFISSEEVPNEVYFPKRKQRDDKARAAYREELEHEDLNGLFIRDIVKERILPDDPRLR